MVWYSIVDEASRWCGTSVPSSSISHTRAREPPRENCAQQSQQKNCAAPMRPISLPPQTGQVSGKSAARVLRAIAEAPFHAGNLSPQPNRRQMRSVNG
jgi:hypothetical protein